MNRLLIPHAATATSPRDPSLKKCLSKCCLVPLLGMLISEIRSRLRGLGVLVNCLFDIRQLESFSGKI